MFSPLSSSLFKILKNKKKVYFLVFLLGLLLIFSSFVPFVQAAKGQASDSSGGGVGQWIVQNVLSEIALRILGGLGMILTWLVGILIDVASYNDFINATAVVNGWAIVRDVANMFFIIILLIIAFGTVLGQEQYHYKRTLPKLLLMALLINFSRTLAGLMIDAAQVVMLTFVNGFQAAGAGNFANALQITEILQFQNKHPSAISTWDVFLMILFGIVIVFISIIVVLVMVVTLILRIVMLWVLIVLSPLAWFLGSFPQGQKYYAKWWDDFRNQVVIGPVFAFFLWLTLVVAGGGNAAPTELGKQFTSENYPPFGENVSGIMTIEKFASYILAIIMLMMSLQIAQEMGGVSAGFASMAKNFLSSLPRKGLMAGARLGWSATKGAAKFIDLQQARLLTGIQLAKIPERFKEGWEARRKKREAEVRARGVKAARWLGNVPVAGALLGALADPSTFAQRFLTWNQGAGIRRAILGSWLDKKLIDKKLIRIVVQNKQKQAAALRASVQLEVQNYQQAKATVDQKKNALAAAQNKVQQVNNDIQQTLNQNRALSQFFNTSASEQLKRFELAKQSGLIDDKMSFTDFNQISPRELTTRALNLQRKLNNQIIQLNNALAQAKNDESIKQRDYQQAQSNFQRIEAAYNQNAPNRAMMLKQAAKLEESARGWENWYRKGDSYDAQTIERMRSQEEKAALEKIDTSRPTPELINEFERAIAKKDKALIASLTKVLAERGDLEALYPRFGIQETGTPGLQAFTQNVLKKNGLEDDYAMKTALRAAKLMEKNGMINYAAPIEVDPITGDLNWRTSVQQASAAAASLSGKNLQDQLKAINPNGITEITAAGVTKLAPQFAAILSAIDSQPQLFEKLIQEGRVVPDLLRQLYNQLQTLIQLQQQGYIKAATVDIIQQYGPNVPPSGSQAQTTAADIARYL